MLGDCYFLSVLSVTTENPVRIRKLFLTEQINSAGAYAINLTKNGVKKMVVVDSYIPCLHNQPCFSAANGNELWVILLEKAWAKVHGSYHRIIGGQCHETFRDLLGAPSFEHITSDEGIFEKIVQAD